MRAFAVLISLAFMLSAYGCSKEEAKQKAKGAATVKKEAQIQPLPPESAKPEELGYTYDPRGRRDPFTPLIAVGLDKGKKARTAGTLEGYDINDFTLAAIAEKKGVRYGLILSPDNKSYTVKEGTVLGLYKGTVKKITNDKVIIIEYSIDYTGKTRPREVVLELRKGKEAE
ncbi:MAG: pilus assembly protein PilP [Nitrospirae bacterium]|nr:pilus assembly protein PilP [Nitrospirota bacterium]